jgi:hypothetical protein
MHGAIPPPPIHLCGVVDKFTFTFTIPVTKFTIFNLSSVACPDELLYVMLHCIISHSSVSSFFLIKNIALVKWPDLYMQCEEHYVYSGVGWEKVATCQNFIVHTSIFQIRNLFIT